MVAMNTRYLLITAGFLALASGFIIASNQQQANDLAMQAVAREQAGHDITADLEVIKGFSEDHMGVSVEVFRKASYEKAVTLAKAAANPGAQGDVYARAQAACAGQTSSVTQSKCTSDYVNANSTPAANPQPVVMPQPADYTSRYRGPVWSTDAAGWFLMASVIFALTAVGLQLRKHT